MSRMENNQQVRVVHVRVGQQPVVLTVDGSLEAYQNLVGGYIEEIGWHMDDPMNPLLGGVSIIVNDDLPEPRPDGLDYNIQVRPDWVPFRGDVFFVRFNAAGDYVSLTDNDLLEINDLLPFMTRFSCYDGPRGLGASTTLQTKREPFWAAEA